MVYIDRHNTNYPLVRGFGVDGHNGEDWALPEGTPVYAVADGIVKAEGYGQDNPWFLAMAGIYVCIEHTDMFTGYAHLSRTVVDAGQAVMAGDLIGYSGSTGNVTGPHLHFEVIDKPQDWNNGFSARIDPAPFRRDRP